MNRLANLKLVRANKSCCKHCGKVFENTPQAESLHVLTCRPEIQAAIDIEYDWLEAQALQIAM